MTKAPPSQPDSQIAIRSLQASDTLMLAQNCWREQSSTQAKQRVQRILAMAERGRLWPVVGLYGGLCVGFGQLARWRAGVEISDMIVGLPWRSRGVGTAIIAHLVNLARQKGFARLQVGVAQANTRAYRLYWRMGFTHLDSHLILDLGNGPEPVVYLSMDLYAAD